MGERIRITLKKSPIGYNKKQKATLVALGLRKLNATVEQPDRPEIRGMIRKVCHLVEVSETDQ
ncbi:MAG TPA: 50S ribosomal protein L30 [Armatimonadota bacterium]|nr:50S ribosomal protein L30 [Armatimonadota bacterium]